MTIGEKYSRIYGMSSPKESRATRGVKKAEAMADKWRGLGDGVQACFVDYGMRCGAEAGK